MVSHVSYQEEHFTSPEACIAAIRYYTDRGWRVSQLRGPQHGPYVIVFRLDDYR